MNSVSTAISKYDFKTMCEFVEKCSLKITARENISNIMPIGYIEAKLI